MKKIIIILMIAIVATSVAFGQTKMAEDSKFETQIIALEKQAWEAWKNKNLAFFQTYLTDDALSVNADGVFNKAQILEYYGSCEVKSYSLDNFKFRTIEKNSALITFTATQDAVCGGEKNPSTVRASSVYIKRGGKWLNSFYTETAATPDNSSVEMQIIALEKQAWEGAGKMETKSLSKAIWQMTHFSFIPKV